MYRKLIIAIFLITFATGVAMSQGNIYPDPSWKKVEPEDHEYDKLKLDRARRYVIDSMKTTGLMVIVGGEVIFEYGNTTQVSYIASCRKSVLAMLLGKYIENGTINLNTTLEELGIDDIGGLLPIERKATIDHLVTSRSGIYHDASNGDRKSVV